jgi:hypothetical protein
MRHKQDIFNQILLFTAKIFPFHENIKNQKLPDDFPIWRTSPLPSGEKLHPHRSILTDQLPFDRLFRR